jgi:GMP synthase-like glutamine amidotransferase
MARIVVFQHSRLGTPGRIGMTLRDLGFRVDVRRLDLPADKGGRPVPPDLDDVAGVVSMGGPQNVGENHPWIKPEQDFLRAAHEASLPVLGVCLGAQLLADALGGAVAPMEAPEVGFAPVDILVPGQTDTLLAGLPWHHWQFHTHEQQITRLPEGAQLLMSSAKCRVQAFRVGMRTLGLQFHPEFDRAGIETVHAEGNLFAAAGVSVDELNRQLDAHYEEFARLGDRLALNFATLCFPYAGLLAG